MLDAPSAPLTTTAQPAAVIHITVPRDHIQEVMGPAIQEVIRAAQAQNIGPKGPVFAQPVGRMKPGEIPGTTIVRTVYTGPYEGLGQAWGDFQDIVESQGHKLGPNLWERYLAGPESGGDASTFRTELNQTIIVS